MKKQPDESPTPPTTTADEVPPAAAPEQSEKPKSQIVKMVSRSGRTWELLITETGEEDDEEEEEEYEEDEGPTREEWWLGLTPEQREAEVRFSYPEWDEMTLEEKEDAFVEILGEWLWHMEMLPKEQEAYLRLDLRDYLDIAKDGSDSPPEEKK